MNTIEIIPTCVPTSVEDLAQKALEIGAYAEAIHIDVTDGIFAPACTWPYRAEGAIDAFDLASAEGLRVEMHLMVQEPRPLGIQFARAGAFRILGHVEAFENEESAHGALDAWRHAGAREVGLGILWDTPFEILEHHMLIMDAVHIMSIARIGTQGIPYESSAPDRVRSFHELHPEMMISVDGGVAESNIVELVKAGARRFGVGSALSRAADPKSAFARLRLMAEQALAP